jgi:hypothetical protein
MSICRCEFNDCAVAVSSDIAVLVVTLLANFAMMRYELEKSFCGALSRITTAKSLQERMHAKHQ